MCYTLLLPDIGHTSVLLEKHSGIDIPTWAKFVVNDMYYILIGW